MIAADGPMPVEITSRSRTGSVALRLLRRSIPVASAEATMTILNDANTSADADARARTRRGERRADLRRVIHAVAATLLRRPADGALQGAFEQALSRLVSARSVRIREVPTRYQARLVTPTRAADAVVLDVPLGDPRRQVVLEASFEPGLAIDEWNLDLLSAAAQLGAVVLEADARRGRPLVAPRLEGAAPLVGASRVMQELRERVERIAATDFTVLVEGESGTGKELVARQIHELSWRRRGPFVAVNCAAIVETLFEAELFGIEDRTATGVKGRRGKFEFADGGTLFLDEVSDLSLAAQAKLLRAIQDLMVERVGGNGARRVDVRIVAASNRPLAGLVTRGAFRADLFYRLGGVEVHVPPLRAHPEDIVELARHFLGRFEDARDFELSDAAADALRIYPWPGNVRELERTMERIVALNASRCIDIEDLPPQVRGEYAQTLEPSIAAADSMRAWGSRYARLIYERCGRNKRKTCRVLGISYHTLDAYLRYARQRTGGRKQLPAWVKASYHDEAQGSKE
jgi:DNA-binding NtrC family response regulator